MKVLGKHYLVEFEGCDPCMIQSIETVEKVLLEAAKLGNATIIDKRFQQFSPTGVSGAIIISESHFAIHTWPEYKHASFDLFTCSQKINHLKSIEYIKVQFNAQSYKCTSLDRGRVTRPVPNSNVNELERLA